MPKNDPPLGFPVRGVPGGWRDIWDDADDHAALRAHASVAESRLLARVAREGRRWQDEGVEERRERDRQRRASSVELGREPCS